MGWLESSMVSLVSVNQRVKERGEMRNAHVWSGVAKGGQDSAPPLSTPLRQQSAITLLNSPQRKSGTSGFQFSFADF